MRTGLLWIGVVVLVAGCARVEAGPPDLVVRRFLSAVATGDEGAAEARLTEEQRQLISREGYGAMRRFLDARFEEFRTYAIMRVAVVDDRAEVDVTLRLPLDLSQPIPPQVEAHGGPARIANGVFVHSHRFRLKHDPDGWRISSIFEIQNP